MTHDQGNNDPTTRTREPRPDKTPHNDGRPTTTLWPNDDDDEFTNDSKLNPATANGGKPQRVGGQANDGKPTNDKLNATTDGGMGEGGNETHEGGSMKSEAQAVIVARFLPPFFPQPTTNTLSTHTAPTAHIATTTTLRNVSRTQPRRRKAHDYEDNTALP